MNGKKLAKKFAFIGGITILLLIPLLMINGLIYERGNTKDDVQYEVALAYADSQVVGAPYITSTIKNSKDITEQCAKLDYKATVDTEVLHRAIYDVTTYSSTIEICGKFIVTSNMLKATTNNLCLKISDFKGLRSLPQLTLNGEAITLERANGANGERPYLVASIELAKGTRAGDSLEFSLTMELCGTESLMFSPMGAETTLAVSSSYPHPSFRGEFLPDEREVRADGFEAKWRVLSMNVNSSSDRIGVEFIDPADPYLQAERSTKYGILIIVLVFIAALFTEFMTRKEINIVQYAVVGLSLVLFYSLLISFAEFILFGYAYIAAAAMTTLALTAYFRAILKSRSAYILGAFVVVVYAANFLLLQMENFALLSGSILLFLLLCVVMYLTANISKHDEATPAQ